MRPRSWLAGTALLLIFTACESGGNSEPGEPAGPDGPEAAAAALAGSLASGDFGSLVFADGATAADVATEYAATVEGLGDIAPAVELVSVSSPKGGATTATYAWSWPLGPDGWNYQTTVPMTLVEDEWQVEWEVSAIEPSIHPTTTLDQVSLTPARGDILGAGGLALITKRAVVRVGIDRTKVGAGRAGASARALAQAVGIDPASYAQQVVAAGELAFIEAIVYRQEEAPAKVLSKLGDIKGAAIFATEMALGPTKGFATPILGTVGEATAEMIEEDPETYALGDVVGLSGLEARYDAQLRGTPGLAVNAVGSDGKTRELFRVDAADGTPVQTTMDLKTQLLAEEVLAQVAPASALVAIQPSTGAILAAANGPGTGGLNIATFGQMAPGSTFKSVSSLALLRAGDTAETPLPCTSTITVDGKVFKNYSDYPAAGIGNIPLRSAVANSCNTAFISQSDRLSGTAIVEAAASLGMGVDHDLGFPAYFGNVVEPTSKTEKAADLIGQGTILASPMTMATVIASIQAGRTVVPSLVTSPAVVDAAGASATVPPLVEAEAVTLRDLLRAVVTSGSGAGLADVPGPPVIAKTGTAEFEKDGKILTHAWMIAAQGDLAVAVFVEEGASGSRTAGPILEAFLRGAAVQ